MAPGPDPGLQGRVLGGGVPPPLRPVVPRGAQRPWTLISVNMPVFAR